MQGVNRYARWAGRPQINTRLTPELFSYVNAMSKHQGLAASAFMRKLVEGYRDGNPLPQAAPLVRAAPVVPIPHMHRTREDTGKSEPIAVLQRIDDDRENARENGKAFRD